MSRLPTRTNPAEQERSGSVRRPARPSEPGSAPSLVSLLTALQAQAGNRATATMVRHGGRPSLAERQQRLREVQVVRQLAGLGSGVSERDAHRYLRLVGVRTPREIVAVATRRPAHRSAYEMVQICLSLPGVGPHDLVALVTRLPDLAVPQLTRLAQVPGRPVGNLVRLAVRLPAHRGLDEAIQLAAALPAAHVGDLLRLLRTPATTVAQLTHLVRGLPGRQVRNLVHLARRVPAHRSLDDAVRVAALLPGTDIRVVVRLLATPRAVPHLTRLLTDKPPNRLDDFMAGLALAHPLSVDNLLELAALPAALDLGFLGTLVTQRSPRVSVVDMARLATELPGRSALDLVALGRLLPRGIPRADVVELGRATSPRTGAHLVALALALPDEPVADLVALADVHPSRTFTVHGLVRLRRATPTSRPTAELALVARRLAAHGATVDEVTSLVTLPGLTGDELVDLVQGWLPTAAVGDLIPRLTMLAPLNLTVAETAHAAALAWAVRHRLPEPHSFLARLVQGGRGLLASHVDVATVINACTVFTPITLAQAMTRRAGNLGNLVTHAADLDAAADLLPVPLRQQLLAYDTLLAAGNHVRAIVTAGPYLRTAALLTAMARPGNNLGNLVTHAADLDTAAQHLGDATAVASLLLEDALLSRGTEVREIVVALSTLPATTLVDTMRAGPGFLVLLHTHRDVVAEALAGQQGVSTTRLRNVLTFQQHSPVARPQAGAPLGQPEVARLRLAQTFGTHVGAILASDLGTAANATYLANLRRAVDTLDGVTWALRDGSFTNAAGTLRLSAWVPVRVDGFVLTHHVIAHLLNPQDPAHCVRISAIRAAVASPGTLVRDYTGDRDWYTVGSIRMVTPPGERRIVTIFFDGPHRR